MALNNLNAVRDAALLAKYGLVGQTPPQALPQRPQQEMRPTPQQQPLPKNSPLFPARTLPHQPGPVFGGHYEQFPL